MVTQKQVREMQVSNEISSFSGDIPRRRRQPVVTAMLTVTTGVSLYSPHLNCKSILGTCYTDHPRDVDWLLIF